MSPSAYGYGLFETRRMGQHDLFLDVLGNRSSRFDQL